MNAVRIGYGLGGLFVVVAAALVLDPGAERSGLAPILFLVWGFLGLLGEMIMFLRSLRTREEEGRAIDSRPADGAVGLAVMAGVASVPNPSDPQIRRFVGTDPDWPETPRAKRETRHAPPLLGKVVWVSLFVGRDGRSWSEDEIARAHDALRRAGVWIEIQAQRWDARVNVDLADTVFVTDDHAPDEVEIAFQQEGESQGPFEARGVTKALIGMSRAAARLGFHDATDLIARINPRLDADVVVWLLHPRRAGRSFAVPLEQTELAGVSLALCYARESEFPEPLSQPPFTDPVTIAHELLHLFGATDKYGVPLDSFPAQSVTSRDMMRLGVTNLSRLRIDLRTAREIGWNSLSGKEKRPPPLD